MKNTRVLPVGSRVRITDEYTSVGRGGESVGKLATVAISGQATMTLRFDGEDAPRIGWSPEALELLDVPEGTLVRVIVDGDGDKDGRSNEAYTGHGFELGETVRRTSQVADSKGLSIPFEHLDGHDFWWMSTAEFEILDEQSVPEPDFEKLAADREQTISDLLVERDALLIERDELRTERKNLQADLADLNNQLIAARAYIERLTALREYTRSLLSDKDIGKLIGFTNGYVAGQK